MHTLPHTCKSALFLRFGRRCLFPSSSSLSAQREKRALSPASDCMLAWEPMRNWCWNVFRLSKKEKKIKKFCVMDWNTRSFGGTHSRCSISFVRRDKSQVEEEARVKTKVGSHVDDLTWQFCWWTLTRTTFYRFLERWRNEGAVVVLKEWTLTVSGRCT